MLYRSVLTEQEKEPSCDLPEVAQQQQTLQLQEGTELITLGSAINPNVHFIKTDAVLGSTAILVQGSSGQIQYAIQPDLLAGQSADGQQIYFSGGSFPVDQGASQAAQILSAFKFDDLYHNPSQQQQQSKLVASTDFSTLAGSQPATIQYVLTSSDVQIVQQSGSHVLLHPVTSSQLQQDHK